jgi:hypothetical protein
LSVKDASRCGVVARMENSVYRAQMHLQSATVQQAVEQFPRLRVLVTRIQREVDKIQIDMAQLKETIVNQGSQPTTAKNTDARTGTGSMTARSNNDLANALDTDLASAIQQQSSESKLGKTERESYSNDYSRVPADEIKQHDGDLLDPDLLLDDKRKNLHLSMRSMLNIIRSVIVGKGANDVIAVQIGGRLDVRSMTINRKCF